MDAHPGTMEAHPGAMEIHPYHGRLNMLGITGAEAHFEAMELWRFALEP
jgi:hypothetical protein